MPGVNMRVMNGEVVTTQIEERLTIRVPGPISEVLVDARRKARTSAMTGEILDYEGGGQSGVI
jgi:hypothetical protein